MFRDIVKMTVLMLVLGLACGTTTSAWAQEGSPDAAAADDDTVQGGQPVDPTITLPDEPVTRDREGQWRRNQEGTVAFVFRDTTIDELVPWISEQTGKVVVNLVNARTKKINVANDKEIPVNEAIDKLFQTLKMNQIGVVENYEAVTMFDLNSPDSIDNIAGILILRPEDPVLGRSDLGNIVKKIFRIRNSSAEVIAEKLTEFAPNYATIVADQASNTIIAQADVEFLQQLQQVITELDVVHVVLTTRTFKLDYADASEVADNILELYQEDETAQNARNDELRRIREARQRAQGGTGNDNFVSGSAELKLTVNVPANTISVKAEPAVVDEIEFLINTYWDVPIPNEAVRTYKLQYTDPLKMRQVLQDVLSQEGSGGGGGARPGQTPQSGGGRSDISEVLGSIYRIEAYPDSQTLVVVAKTEQSLALLDNIIKALDQPLDPIVPLLIELKHANAQEVAEVMNALLAAPGARAALQRQEEGLSGTEFLQQEGGGLNQQNQQEAGNLEFPWQQAAGQQGEERAESPLIGTVRIVPVHRQNAILIHAPVEIREAVRRLIVNRLDQPGRQVLIKAVIVEVELDDNLAYGIRFSSNGDILSGSPTSDFQLGGSGTITIGENPLFGDVFDTSILDTEISVSALVQAVSEVTNVRILQEPRVFTADNHEATFFDGQDVPFLQGTQSFDTGTVNENFEYRPVGIVLQVRPRITVERDVDLEINLELSSVVPGQTLFGAFIVDRRQTNTKVIVENGQTIVLSGIMTENESEIVRKVPILGDIPVVRHAFRHKTKSNTRTELMAFITPIVVDNPSANYDNFTTEDIERGAEMVYPLDEQAPIIPAYERKPLDTSAGRQTTPGVPEEGRTEDDLLDGVGEPGETTEDYLDQYGEAENGVNYSAFDERPDDKTKSEPAQQSQSTANQSGTP